MVLFQRTVGKRTGGCGHQVEQRKAQHLFQGKSVSAEFQRLFKSTRSDHLPGMYF